MTDFEHVHRAYLAKPSYYQWTGRGDPKRGFMIKKPLQKIVQFGVVGGLREALACKTDNYIEKTVRILLAPAVTVGETEGAMDSASVCFFASSFAYNFVRK